MRVASLWALVLASGCARSPFDAQEASAPDAAVRLDGGEPEGAGEGADPRSPGEDAQALPDDAFASRDARAVSSDSDSGPKDASSCGDTLGNLSQCGSCNRACPISATSCSDGLCQFQGCSWKAFEGADYLFCNSKSGQTWEAARTFCQDLGMDLAIIETVEEDAFVATLAIDYWIGGSDQDSEGTFRWVVPGGGRSGTAFWSGLSAMSGGAAAGGAFTNWFAFDPNDANTGEDCITYLSNDWWDHPCNEEHGLVCEPVRPAL